MTRTKLFFTWIVVQMSPSIIPVWKLFSYPFKTDVALLPDSFL